MGGSYLHSLIVLFIVYDVSSVYGIDGFAEKVPLRLYPWLAAIEVNNSYECPAAVITPTHILAPLQCVYTAKVSEIKVRTGTDRRLEGGKLHEVSNKFTVEDSSTMIDLTGKKVSVNDIVVLQLKDRVDNKTSPPVQLAHKCVAQDLEPDVLVKVVGWGNPIYSECKNEVEMMTVPILAMECCNTTFEGQLRQGQFCAGFKDAIDQDSHLADLGDLMVHEDRLVGIVSYDTSSDDESKPIVYTNVGFYHKFIASHTGLKDEDLNDESNHN